MEDEALPPVVADILSDPGQCTLRPFVRAMTRDPQIWAILHPQMGTPRDCERVRRAINGSTENAAALQAHHAAIREMLAEVDASGTVLPPLALPCTVEAALVGGQDDLISQLPPGSFVLFDRADTEGNAELVTAAVRRARQLGVGIGLSGLELHRDEAPAVELVAPDLLVIDRLPALDRCQSKDPVRTLLRVAAPGAVAVMAGVTNPVEEWAAVTVGAALLAGRLFHDLPLPTSAPAAPEEQAAGASAGPAGPGTATTADSPFALLQERHPVHEGSLGKVLTQAVEMGLQATLGGQLADAYSWSSPAFPLPQRLIDGVDELVAAGAAVTVLTDDRPMDEWVLVLLVPGHGHVLSVRASAEASPQPDDVAPSEADESRRGYAYIHADDRELALRIANHISTQAQHRAGAAYFP